jgi:photosystem II stability/assembly factor-like uncharacterized protein
MRNKIIIPWIVSLLFAVSVKAQWTDISIPANTTITNATFVDDLRGYVASGTEIWRTLDAGLSWDSTTFIGSVVDVDFSNDMNGYVLIQGNGNYRLKSTNDGGDTWNYLNWMGGPFKNYYGMITTNPNNIFISSYNWIIKTHDGGLNWDTVTFLGYPMCMDKEKINDDTLFFTGWDGTFMYEGQVTRSFDSGNTWNVYNTNDNYTNFDGSHFINGMNGYAVYHRGWGPDTSVISYTSDGGQSWNEIYYDTSIVFHDVYMKNSTQGFLIATEGTTGKIQYTNDGINFTDEFTTTNNTIHRLYHAENTLYAVGSNGLVMKKNVPLGISDFGISNFEFFPNPSNDFIQLKNVETMNLTMTDINGKLVLSKIIQPNERIDIGNLGNGMYFLTLKNGKEIQQGKIIISK